MQKSPRPVRMGTRVPILPIDIGDPRPQSTGILGTTGPHSTGRLGTPS